MRAQELAAFAWRISNRKKLLDHLELTTEEVAAYQSGREAAIFDQDRGFFMAWEAMRKGGTPEVVRQGVAAGMETTKRSYREHLRSVRSLFHEPFRVFEEVGHSRGWDGLLAELETGPEIPGMIRAAVDQSGRARRIPDVAAVANLQYDVLPGTACWIQYYIALSYLATFGSGKTSKPDMGDQVDFRHAAYAGICDVFVTGDRKMREVLQEYVPACRARVLAPHTYLDEMTGG